MMKAAVVTISLLEDTSDIRTIIGGRLVIGENKALYVCYLDESGDTGLLPYSTSPVQPVLCVLGLSLDLEYLREFTLEFIDLKYRFFPGLNL